jgi:hypothetical protein
MLERVAQTKRVFEFSTHAIHRAGIEKTLAQNSPLDEKLIPLGRVAGKGAHIALPRLARSATPSLDWVSPSMTETEPVARRLRILEFAREVSLAWVGTSASTLFQSNIPGAFLIRGSPENAFFGPVLTARVMKAARLLESVLARMKGMGETASAYDALLAEPIDACHTGCGGTGFEKQNIQLDIRLLEDEIQAVACELSLGFSTRF